MRCTSPPARPDSYRLCPASELLSEECFQKHPLDFVETEQAILFANGSKHPIKGTFVNKGTQPEGSTWSMLPIVRHTVTSHCAAPRCQGKIMCRLNE